MCNGTESCFEHKRNWVDADAKRMDTVEQAQLSSCSVGKLQRKESKIWTIQIESKTHCKTESNKKTTVFSNQIKEYLQITIE